MMLFSGQPANLLQFKKILIVNPFGIGDVLFTTPLIRQLKDAHPRLSIGYVANRRAAEVLKNNPLVNQVFIYERDEWQAVYRRSKREFLKILWSFIDDVRREKFDAVLDLSLNPSAGFLCWWLGIPKRIGFDYKKRGRFLNVRVPLKGYEGKPVADHYNDLLPHLGLSPRPTALEMPLKDADLSWAQTWLEQNGLSADETFFVIVPGGGASWGKTAGFKRWAAENFAKLADKLIEKFNAAIILMGDVREEELCRQVVNAMHNRAFSLAGKTSLGQFAAMTKRARIVVLNDGGPLHVAVAAKARTVSIFGPVDETVYGPYAGDLRSSHAVVAKSIPCRPCYRRFRMSDCEHHSCLKGLTLEEVLKKVESLLAAQP